MLIKCALFRTFTQKVMEEEGLTCGTPLDHFAESKELSSIVSTLPNVCGELRPSENAIEKFTEILDKYQEQPHLLDPYLESLIAELFTLAWGAGEGEGGEAPPSLMHHAFKFLYLISKVRGAKVVVRWFSHEVSDLQPVLQLLQKQDIKDHETWETRYILLLWLSIISMIPFDLTRMDGSAAVGGAGGGVDGSGGHQRTIDRIVEAAKMYLHVTDKSRDAAAMLLAKFLSRPDVKKLKLPEFLDWCLMIINTADKGTMHGMTLLQGVLSTLSSLFKHAKRDDVVDFAPTVLEHVSKCNLTESDNTLLRKLNIKLVQRLGMTFLQARVATWRYQRGSRSLEETLATSAPSTSPSGGQGTSRAKGEDEGEAYDVPEEIEEVIGLLLNGLRDRDTVVRWSAAKGVGRITGRLPKELADEVVQSLLEFFSVRESDGAWHGGCLALAELGRRGLLIPQRLSEVVPVVLKALSYDERRGVYSIGSHVRDAACYVCWSFARAYEPEELKPYVNTIASGLVVTTLFDREVNCRRAAAAAFQENVGRQGTFPHGIDILTTADYFAVGSRGNAYLGLSVFVAQYPEYTRALIDHLVQQKLGHWDSSLRELSAQALHNLTKRDVPYMKDQVLPSLLPLVTTSDPSLRHGALYAVAELTHALSEHAQSISQTLVQFLGQDIITELVNIAPRLISAEVFKGAIGEIMRPTALRFIEKMCVCALPLPPGSVSVSGVPQPGQSAPPSEKAASPPQQQQQKQLSVLETWQWIVDDNLPHTEESIREAAVSALTHLCSRYYSTDPETVKKAQDALLDRYIARLTDPLHFARMGFSLALGGLPKSLLVGRLDHVMRHLTSCVANIKGTDSKFVEARRDAIRAITRICQTVCVATSGSCDQCLCHGNVGVVYKSLFAAMEDYTKDSRGDIGAVVREAAMTGLEEVTLLITTNEPSFLSPDIVRQAVCCLVQQSNEKIDRTRAHACSGLMTFVHHDPPIPHIPHHQELLTFFKKSSVSDINWTVPQLSFPLMVPLLGLPSFTYSCLLGLIVSVGGLTESTVRQSSSSLLGYLKGVSKSASSLEPFTDNLLAVFRTFQKDDRIILPLMKTLDLLLSNGAFDVFISEESHEFPSSLLALMKAEVLRSKDAVKLLTSINVFCGLLQFPSIRMSTLNRIMVFLCHGFPRIRKTAADQFYITLVTYDDIIDTEVADEVIGILSETAWDGEIDSVREQRNVICDLLKLPRPKPPAKSSASKKPKMEDKLASYRDLVERAGY